MPDLKTKTGSSNSTEESSLCFDKNDFMKENFSVDEFLHKNRNAPSLEQLRDNLGLYLKGLRASMIDLINEDYADFVSLSGNLVGLDQSIDVIQRPLEQFREEIVSIQTLIQDNETEIRAHLERKRELRELKRNLQSLQKVHDALDKLKDLLEAPHQLDGENDHFMQIRLERAALELIQLRFNERFCTSYLNAEQLQSIERMQEQLLAKLRTLFTAALQSASSVASEPLERVLRIYLTLGAATTAEAVFREDVVAPYMSATISEHCLQNSPQGLAGVYSRILNFISLHMTDLLRLTQYASSDKLRGFDFLVQSFWVDVEMRLETHMTSIFAPGNSEVFYAKYKSTRDFLAKIEELLAGSGSAAESVQSFRKHKQTRSFQARWNLPVYFQICFQEIAGEFEALLEPTLRDDTLITSDSSATSTATEFQLTPFNGAHQAIQRCWTEGVYLPEVFPKFYKLTVQIVSRLSRWIDDVNRFATTANKTAETSSGFKLSKTNLLIALHADLQKFIALLPDMQENVFKNIPKEKQAAVISDTIVKSFSDLQQMLSAHLQTLQESLVRLLIVESGAENVRQVNDLPRLFRKTNRDVPTRSSAYVDQMLRPLKSFATEQQTQLGQEIVAGVLEKVFNKITNDYFVAVSDVLTSVQKTEESLRRLRNLKSGAAATMTASTSSSSLTVSDDDKIRLQLRVDVIAWTAELAKLKFMPTQIDKLLDLNNIVEESIKLKE